jgi:ribonuclease G
MQTMIDGHATRRRGAGGGFILRTNGEDASDAELAEDIAYLRKTWTRIKRRCRRGCRRLAAAPGPEPAAARAARPGERETQTIRLDSREQFGVLQAFGLEFMPQATEQAAAVQGRAADLRPVFNIDEEIAKALGRRVDLKSGGYLIVDQTEALTTVDVNTGGFVGARNFDDTIFKTNLEAAHAIARQLRLRNLGGIIIVDFIDMQRDDHRDAGAVGVPQAART